MSIPVYRHNLEYDDWEVASVYASDDCRSLGGSAYDESLHSSGPLYDSVPHPEDYFYDDGRPRFVNGYPVPQQQRQNYPPATHTRPHWDAHYALGQPSSFVVPPPGVVFPPNDWALLPQDTYWPSTTTQIVTSSDTPVDVGLVETSTLPPLLLSPSSPPPAPSPLIKWPLAATTIAHGHPSHATSVTLTGTGKATKVEPHASPFMPPPPRYHEVAHVIAPRLADTVCQAHAGTAMSPLRRSGHDVSTSYASGPGHAPMPRGARPSEESTSADGRYGVGGTGGHPSYGPGDRQDAHPGPPVPGKREQEREHEHESYDGGRTRAARPPQTRERRPSIWQRFVRRFSPSHGSVGL